MRGLRAGHVLELVPMSEHVTKLSAVCIMCRRDAAFTTR
jgi:thymidine kinase